MGSTNDEALERWLEAELPTIRQSWREGVDPFRFGARAAWRAAVKHTLGFVADELNMKAYKTGGLAVPAANVMRNLADDVRQMEP